MQEKREKLNVDLIKKKIQCYGVEAVLLIFLLLYPLRHITWGLDLWDTGYNYSNFAYMGMEHMDSMWLFSTYLASAVGRFLTFLPGGHCLVGMNLYTGLFVSGLAIAGYLFSARKLGIPKGIAFLGEFVAMSLSWSPTAALYNYLTYVFFSACIMLLYLGLTKDNKWYLYAAGICLGTNVLVRFSNLPEAAMIVAVWAYAYIAGWERRKRGVAAVKGQGAWAMGFRHTLWCLAGYLSAWAVLFGYIQLRYGLDEYITGVMRLFAMTDKATDYKPIAMIMSVIGTYVENLYWVVRIGVIAIVGTVVCSLADTLVRRLGGKVGKKKTFDAILWILKLLFSAALGAVMIYWLYMRGFCSFLFDSYDSMRRPGILFLTLVLLVGAVRVLHPGAAKEEKLISGMLMLVVILTSFGSNNELYPSMNHLYLAAPYVLWESWKFLKLKPWQGKRLELSSLPAKCILAAFLGMCLFQIGMFGVKFSFVEARGARDLVATVDNNEVLKGMKMPPERARWMTELTAYVKENNLQGREVIPYGNIPAIGYYLEMPPAFNSWSDLESYHITQLELQLDVLTEALAAGAQQRPVVIMEKAYGDYYRGNMSSLDELKANESKYNQVVDKLNLLREFMEQQGYEETFSNEKFVVWE